MSYDYKTLEGKYKSLPTDIQLAMASTDVTKTILEIAEKHDLFIDQADELSDEVSYVMLGLTRSKDFIKTISKVLEIDEKKAIEIAQDINKEIFDKMRDSLRKIEDAHGGSEYTEDENVVPEKSQSDQSLDKQAIQQNRARPGDEAVMTDAEKAQQKSVIAAVEQAGGFVIDRPLDQAPLMAEEMVHDAIVKNLGSKKDSINILEKDITLKPKIEAPSQPKTNVSLEPKIPESKIETPLPPDHLLGDTPELVQTPQQETQKTASAPKKLDQTSIVDTLLSKGVAMPMDSGTPKPENKNRPYDGTDPYREPIE